MGYNDSRNILSKKVKPVFQKEIFTIKQKMVWGKVNGDLEMGKGTLLINS